MTSFEWSENSENIKGMPQKGNTSGSGGMNGLNGSRMNTSRHVFGAMGCKVSQAKVATRCGQLLHW